MKFTRYIGNKVAARVTGGKLTKPSRMQALIRLPTLLRLAYALLRDERVPLWQRSVVVSVVGLAISPLDIVGNIPVLGQFWDMTIVVMVLDLFIQQAPAHVVNEHIVRLGLENKIKLRKL